MAWTRVRAGGTLDAASATSFSITPPVAGHAAGNALVIVVAGPSDPGTVTIADSQGNTYVPGVRYWSAANFGYVGIFVANLSVSLASTDTITVSSTNSVALMGMSLEYNASAGFSAAFDSTNTADGGFLAPWVSGQVTPTAGKSALAIAVGFDDGTNGSGSNTPAAGWTEQYDVKGTNVLHSLVVEDQIISSTSGTVGHAPPATGTNKEGAHSGAANTIGAIAVILETSGAAPVTSALPQPRIPNPKVGPNALRFLARRRRPRFIPMGTSAVSTTPVSVSINVVIDAAQAIATAVAEAIESAAAIATTLLGPLDAAGGIATTSQQPLDATGGIASTGQTPLDEAGGIAATASEPLDATASVSPATASGPVDAAAGITTASSEPIEAAGGVAATSQAPLDAAGAITAAGASAIDTLGGLATSGALPIDEAQRLAAGLQEVVDALGGIATAASEPVEALQGITAGPSDPIDAQGNTPVSQTLTLAIEALGGIAATSPTAVDELTNAATVAATSWEALAVAAQLLVAPVEALSGVRATQAEPVESAQRVAATLQLSLETLTRVLVAGGLPYEVSVAVAIAAIVATTRTRSAPGSGLTAASTGSGLTRTDPDGGITSATGGSGSTSTAGSDGETTTQLGGF